MTRIAVLILLMAMTALPLSACGRKGDPEAPPGSTYPAQYPK